MWQYQKKILGFYPASEAKVKARRIAYSASRTNTILSIALLISWQRRCIRLLMGFRKNPNRLLI